MARRLLYLVRHGDHRLASGDDPDEGGLSPLGVRQTEFLADRLSDLQLACIHHSPWPRAAEMAVILASRHPGVPGVPVDPATSCRSASR